MYTLIIISFVATGHYNNRGSTVANVPGFTSLASCETASAVWVSQAKALNVGGRAFCVKL